MVSRSAWPNPGSLARPSASTRCSRTKRMSRNGGAVHSAIGADVTDRSPRRSPSASTPRPTSGGGAGQAPSGLDGAERPR